MDSYSVGSNQLPSPPPNPNHHHHHHQQQSIQPPRNSNQNPLPISQRRERDTCFYCKKQGHWSIDCPEKQKTHTVNKEMTTTTTVSPSSPTTLSSSGATIPEMQCPCGGGICYIRTSNTEKNPGRQFYKCPRRSTCSFFKWCDERSSDEEGVRVAVSPYPMCSCGAGPCNRFKVKKEGNNKGRFFFVCPVSKGQGACNFFQWEDEIKQSPQSTLAVQESPEMVEKTVKQGAYGQYGNEIKESFSPGSVVVRGSESRLREEYPVKEVEVGSRSNSRGVDEKILSPMRNLRVSEEEESNTSSPVGKPGKWIECFKCGEIGHGMKDCTAS